MFETIGKDLPFAAMYWGRSPGITLATLLTIPPGIGTPTTVFSVADAVLFRTPPGIQ